jgi:hypothetical protein
MADSIREHDPEREEAEWHLLHDRITEALDQFGKKDAFGKGDYWLVDEHLHAYRHDLEVQNLSLLRPEVIKLQELLHGYPHWEIFFTVDPGKEKWPGMGIIIRDDEIIDELQREHLPEEFRSFVYRGTK